MHHRFPIRSEPTDAGCDNGESGDGSTPSSHGRLHPSCESLSRKALASGRDAILTNPVSANGLMLLSGEKLYPGDEDRIQAKSICLPVAGSPNRVARRWLNRDGSQLVQAPVCSTHSRPLPDKREAAAAARSRW